jgi:hypothetical protein
VKRKVPWDIDAEKDPVSLFIAWDDVSAFSIHEGTSGVGYGSAAVTQCSSLCLADVGVEVDPIYVRAPTRIRDKPVLQN